MTAFDKQGNIKPAKQLINEARKRQAQEKLRLINNTNYRMRGFIMSDREWWRLNHSVRKIKNDSPTGATKQIIVNNIFKDFNDKILGEGNNE